MNADRDEALARLLLEGAPPERDPFFRIALIERRTRQRYRQRQRTLLVIAAVAALLPALAFAAIQSLGVALLPATLAVIFGAGLVAASVFSLRGVRQVMRQVRAAQRAR
jgi:peptidoglycan/LPS O-acetylase OafA/YrhL